MPGTTSGPAVALALPFTPRSAAVARTRLQQFLQQRALPEEIIDDSRLVVSELIGNAVRHARPLSDGTMVVGWDCPEDDVVSVDIFVTDGGSESVPQTVVSEPVDGFGRGLTLVEALAQRWWYEATDEPESRGTVHALLVPEADRTH